MMLKTVVEFPGFHADDLLYIRNVEVVEECLTVHRYGAYNSRQRAFEQKRCIKFIL